MPSKRPTLAAQARTATGRKVKKLRREGKIPANIFGKKTKSQAITLSLADFQKVYKEAGETGLVDIVISGEKTPRPCLIANVHLHPVTDLPLHADLHQVDLTEKVTAHVPVELVGEAPVVKDKGGLLITLLDEIEVEALPTDLPEKFEIDVTGLKEFNDAILVKDIKVDRSKITLTADAEETIVKAQEPKEEEVIVEAPAPAEGEAPADVSAEAGAKAEGEAKPEESAKPTAEAKPEKEQSGGGK